VRKRSYGTPLGTGLAAAVLAIALAAAPSLATTAKTWTVKPGGKFSGRSSSRFTFTDANNRVAFVCSPSSISGKFRSGSGLPGTHIASITAFSFGPSFSCTNGILNFTWAFGDFPYYLNANSYDAASGETTAHITGIAGALSGSGCTLTLSGTKDTTPGEIESEYINSTHKLKIITSGSTLHVHNVSSGCAAAGVVWNNGDPMTISGTYTVAPKQAITSP
jgi:hypothetical protein